MDYQRIFILLGLAVTAYMLILAWNEDYGSQSAAEENTSIETTYTKSATQVPDLVADTESTVPDLIPETNEERFEEPVRAVNQTVNIITDVLEIELDLVGGDIVSVSLPGYPANLDTPDVPFGLVDPRNGYEAQSGLIGPDGTDTSNNRPVYQVDKYNFEMASADELVVDLKLAVTDELTVIKQFVFVRGDYLVRVRYLITNKSDNDFRAAMFGQIKRDSATPIMQDTNAMGLRPYVGGATRTGEELYAKLEFEDLAEEPFKGKMQGGYMALVQHYFVSAWIPGAEANNTYQARKLGNQDVYLFGFTSPLVTIPANSEGSLEAGFYVGPKDQYRLQDLAEGLDLTVDYGFLWWLAQPLFYLLTMLHDLVDNWGFAIILLTVIVKSLLYPLSATSFRSMAKMRKLQPEMVRLKERYGDDRQQFSQAMMELYKKEGANPLGGCFPILLQMPVFLALYWTLMESVELRQAPFILWINDLSVMDPYFVLPILMGVSMYLTQLMQPEPPDPVQAKVFKLMPIMFTFFFLWFPSGLVLYWLVNNILSIAQQFYVTRQIEKGA